MNYITKHTQLLAKSLILSLGLTLAACGGGDVPTSSTVPTATVSYTGDTNEATVDTTSAVELTKAYITANQENVGGLVTGATITSTQETLDSDAKNLLIEQLKQQVINSLNNQSSIVTAASVVLAGNCIANYVPDISDDGTVTETVLTNSNTEATGKLSYNNLCLYDAVVNAYTIVNGDVYYTVKGDIQAGIFDSMILNVPSLTVYFKNIATSDEFTETISEYISFVFEYDVIGDLTTITLYVHSDIDVAGTVYRFEVVSITDFSGTGTSSTLAKFYHPDYGSVTYVDNLTYSSCDGTPDGGDFKIITTSITYTITPSGACDNTYTVTTAGT